jgi:hypothetical protein
LSRQLDLDSFDRPVLFGSLETVTVDRGIDDRFWGPAPTEALPEDEQDDSRGEDVAAMARLATEDIDTDDLLALIADPDATGQPDTGTQARGGAVRGAADKGRRGQGNVRRGGNARRRA